MALCWQFTDRWQSICTWMDTGGLLTLWWWVHLLLRLFWALTFYRNIEHTLTCPTTGSTWHREGFLYPCKPDCNQCCKPLHMRLCCMLGLCFNNTLTKGCRSISSQVVESVYWVPKLFRCMFSRKQFVHSKRYTDFVEFC